MCQEIKNSNVFWVNHFCGCLSTQSAWFFPGDDYWDISHGKDVTAIEKLGVYTQITILDWIWQMFCYRTKSWLFYNWWKNVWEQPTMKTSRGFLRHFIEFFTRKPRVLKVISIYNYNWKLHLKLYHHMNPVSLIRL